MGIGGLLGHVTWTIYINFCYPFIRRLHIKFGFDRLAVFDKKIFDNNGHIFVYSPGTVADNPLGQIDFINSIIQSMYSYAASSPIKWL